MTIYVSRIFKIFEDNNPPTNQPSTHPERTVEKAGLDEEGERSLNLRPAGWPFQVGHDTATMIPVVVYRNVSVKFGSEVRRETTWRTKRSMR